MGLSFCIDAAGRGTLDSVALVESRRKYCLISRAETRTSSTRAPEPKQKGATKRKDGALEAKEGVGTGVVRWASHRTDRQRLQHEGLGAGEPIAGDTAAT